VNGGNIAELAATAFVAPLIVLLSVRTIGYRGEQCGGGESVSQLPLKDNAFSTSLGQTHGLSHGPKWDYGASKSLYRQTVVAPLSLIAVQLLGSPIAVNPTLLAYSLMMSFPRFSPA
jgi:hypothetical protein